MRFTLALVAFAAGAFAQLSSAPSSGSKVSSGTIKVSSSGTPTGSALTPSGSADISALTPCILGCLNAVGPATSCLTFTNVQCVCTNPDFQQKAASCFQTECKASEVGPALQLQQSQCGALSATGAPSATTPFTPANSAADISAPGSVSSPASSSGGSGSSASPTKGAAVPAALPGLGLVGAVTVFGALIGAAAIF
ncbi:hypothetical protein C8F01DRAFT_1136060 [Mycena amicta]|nr:hypothetical protein C8F01DRAFT_1136060 [Mycena amicta]